MDSGLKKTPIQLFSCEYCEIFQSIYFKDYLQTAASGNCNNYNLQSQSDVAICEGKNVYKGSNSLRYFGPIVLNVIPKEIKSVNNLIALYVKFSSGNLILALVDYANTTSLTLDL